MDEKTSYLLAAECLEPLKGLGIRSVEGYLLQRVADKISAAILMAVKESEEKVDSKTTDCEAFLDAVEKRTR